jgi:alpha-beta hydrolase superfamily lysophospholipase
LLSRKRLKRAAWVLGILVILWLLASFLVAYRFTRRPQARFEEPAPQVSWGKLEELRLQTKDGLGIGAWYAPGADDSPAVLLLHGNKASRASSLSRAAWFAQEGCSVLLISLRAHGDSDGDFNDLGYSARHDVVAAVAYLEGRRPKRPILVQGTSLGAGAAVFAAPELGKRVSGYLLEGLYRDLHTSVRNRTKVFLPPLLDGMAYSGLVLVGPLVLPDADRIAPVEFIGQIPETVPVLLLAGSADDRARPDEARALHECVASHGRLVFFEGAGHESFLEYDPALFRASVLPLLRDVKGLKS